MIVTGRSSNGFDLIEHSWTIIDASRTYKWTIIGWFSQKCSKFTKLCHIRSFSNIAVDWFSKVVWINTTLTLSSLSDLLSKVKLFWGFSKNKKCRTNVMITWHGLYLLSQRERGISINLPIGPYITYVISRGRIRLLLKRIFPTISNSYIGSSKRAGEERSEAQNQLNFCPFEMQCNALQCTGGAGAEGYYWQSKNCTGNRSKGEDTHLCWPQKDW